MIEESSLSDLKKSALKPYVDETQKLVKHLFNGLSDQSMLGGTLLSMGLSDSDKDNLY